MKHVSIRSTFTPRGYTGRHFNNWQAQLQKSIDKVRKTNVSEKIKN